MNVTPVERHDLQDYMDDTDDLADWVYDNIVVMNILCTELDVGGIANNILMLHSYYTSIL